MKKKTKKFNLTVLGKNCDSEKRTISDITPLVLSKLVTTRMMNTISLRIEVRATKLQKNWIGSAINNPNGSQVDRNYTVIIKRGMDIEEMIKTLIHEMVHVYQFATNKLQYRYWKSDKQLHARWDGEEKGVKDRLDYWTSPWEVEARAITDKMYNQIIKEYKEILNQRFYS